jgi:NADPH-dependent 2,4-dienoyl-CoA reductase/sulfur reductase-like enzyme
LIDIAATPMLSLGPELGAWCAELHRDRGVDLRLETGVSALLGNGHVEAVELTDGTRIAADVVVVGLGALPNTEWLADSGLRVHAGLACDVTLTAVGDPDILGAGDVISWPHPLAGGEAVRIEHWTVAAEHGQLAGRNALRAPAAREPYVAPPYFWSDQYDVKIQAVGLPGRAERLEVLERSADGSRIVCAGEHDGRLVGAIAINAAKRLGVYRRALVAPPAFEELRATVTADAAALGAPVGAA